MWDLIRECCRQHLHIATARIKRDRETEEEGKQEKLKIESTVGTENAVLT